MPKASINGIDLYYEVQGTGAPVLLIAGFTADHMSWLLQVPAVAQEFQCISYDNRGTGQSTVPEGPYTIRQMADDAVALLDHLGISKAHVVGHSMGGAIGQELAINYPDRVSSLLLLATWGKGDERSRRGLEVWKQCFLNLQLDDYMEYLFQYLFTHRMYDQPGAVDMVKMQMLANPYPTGQTGFLGQMAACQAHDTLDRLGQIKAPTLVWAAAEDAILPPRFSKVLAERIPGAEYYESEGTGHMLNMEGFEATNAKLLEWLRGMSR